MPGAIAGDVIGSVYERRGIRSKEFPLFGPANRFTDDTVLTCAVADRLLHGGDYVPLFHDSFHRYPNAGYGGTFIRWALACRSALGRPTLNAWRLFQSDH